jgi:hypothetical protein
MDCLIKLQFWTNLSIVVGRIVFEIAKVGISEDDLTLESNFIV